MKRPCLVRAPFAGSLLLSLLAFACGGDDATTTAGGGGGTVNGGASGRSGGAGKSGAGGKAAGGASAGGGGSSAGTGGTGGASSGQAGMGGASAGAGGTSAGGSSAGKAGNGAAGTAGSSSGGAGKGGAQAGGSSGGKAGAGGSSGGKAGAGGVSAAGAGGSSAGNAGAAGGPPTEEFPLHAGAPPLSPFLVVDQFGYRPTAEKIAIARDPVTGFDAAESFTPGKLAVVDAATGNTVLEGDAIAWNGGATDPQAGDKLAWFDFSALQSPGRYYVKDVGKNVRSPTFSIDTKVYRRALEAAVRTFFYQRAGQDKPAQWAGAGWVDGPSHVGPGQDLEARRYDATGDASTAKDVSGGWYDAGDYNKYTVWTARYATTLLHAWVESPTAFGDDTRIPESGNGVPDIVDEARWGLAHLGRLQQADGSVLSIVGVDHASPPSAAKGPSRYGRASTTSTRGAAMAFAYGAFVLGKIPSLAAESAALKTRALSAWTWAEANPSVVFKNNDGGSGTSGLGAGQQEFADDARAYGWSRLRLEGALYLFLLTGETSYRAIVEQLAPSTHLLEWSFAYPFEGDEQAALLTYAAAPNATPATVQKIVGTYAQAMKSDENFGAYTSKRDGYGAYLKDYTWGTNRTRATQGAMLGAYADLSTGATAAEAERAAERFVHALHGVNPLGLVYLSNVQSLGAERSVREFYHAWFSDGSALWDRAGVSTYGPAPGFLVGGPNPSYEVDGCCPNDCGSAANNTLCTAEPLSPPRGQPPQKSFKEFNTSWPVSSWSVTENSNGYQVEYIRLLARFAR